MKNEPFNPDQLQNHFFEQFVALPNVPINSPKMQSALKDLLMNYSKSLSLLSNESFSNCIENFRNRLDLAAPSDWLMETDTDNPKISVEAKKICAHYMTPYFSEEQKELFFSHMRHPTQTTSKPFKR